MMTKHSTINSTISLTTIVAVGVVIAAITTPMTAVVAQEVFESEDDGFRLQVPQGWVIQDDDNEPLGPHGEDIAVLCLENEALPAIAGGYNCEAADLSDYIVIERWPNLQSIPEFENITSSNYTITTDDLLALRIQYLYNNGSVFGIKIENSTDVDEFTKLVNMIYTLQDQVNIFLTVEVDRKSSQMYVLSQDRNTGYSIVNSLNNTQTIQHSPAVQEVFNSFEVVS